MHLSVFLTGLTHISKLLSSDWIELKELGKLPIMICPAPFIVPLQLALIQQILLLQRFQRKKQ